MHAFWNVEERLRWFLLCGVCLLSHSSNRCCCSLGMQREITRSSVLVAANLIKPVLLSFVALLPISLPKQNAPSLML